MMKFANRFIKLIILKSEYSMRHKSLTNFMLSSLLLPSESRVNLWTFTIDFSLTDWWSRWLPARLSSLRRRHERNILARSVFVGLVSLRLSISRLLRGHEESSSWSINGDKDRSSSSSVKRNRNSCFSLFRLKLISSILKRFLNNSRSFKLSIRLFERSRLIKFKFKCQKKLSFGHL